MHILVCIKQIQNISMEENCYSNMNPNDLDALECALQLKEQGENITVTAITMGNLKSEEILKEALTLGADNGILISDSCYRGSDTLATATVLATAIEKLKPVPLLVLCGGRTRDGETGQVGAELSQFLKYSYAGYVTEVEKLTEEYCLCKRQLDTGTAEISLSMPVVLSIEEGSYPIRDKTFWGLQKARRCKIETWNNEFLQVPNDRCGLTGSATQVVSLEKITREKADSNIYVFEKGTAEMVLQQVLLMR